MRKLYFLLLPAVLFSAFLLPLAFAQYGTGYFDITDFFNNTIVRFVLVFLLFYVVIFFAVQKAFYGNKGIAVVVAMVVSLFITATIAERGILEGYFTEDIGSVLLLLGVLALFGFVFRAFYTKVSKAMAFVLLFIFWLILFFTSPNAVLPYSLQTNYVLFVYSMLSGWLGLIILVLAGTISILHHHRKDKGLQIQVRP